jgi:hypothetical protein
MVIGMVAIVGSKQKGPNEYPTWAMWSAHSWLGALALACWGAQLLATVVLRVCKTRGLIVSHQRLVAEVHRFCGQAVYALLLSSCATGLQSRQSSDMSVVPALPVESQLPAGVCVLLVALGMSTYAALAYLPSKSVRV